MSASVAVVGAGIAGLSAARVLADNGLDVTVFDKGRSPGGRMSTRREGDYRFDHGAPFFTVSDDRFAAAVSEWESRGVVTRWDARLRGIDRRVPLFIGVPGMNALCADLAAGLNVITGVRVAGARRAGRSWWLQGEYASDLGRYDRLVVTAPPKQTEALVGSAPGLRHRVRGVPMSPCWAVMAVLDETLKVGWDAAAFEDTPVALAVRNSAKPGRPQAQAWVLHASHRWTASHLEADPASVGERLLHEFFARCVEADAARPRTLFVTAHRWRYSRPTEPLADGFLWDAGAGAGVCGDWCHGGGVEGAFLSGAKLAQRVVQIG